MHHPIALVVYIHNFLLVYAKLSAQSKSPSVHRSISLQAHRMVSSDGDLKQITIIPNAHLDRLRLWLT
jgi:hypothetical protein